MRQGSSAAAARRSRRSGARASGWRSAGSQAPVRRCASGAGKTAGTRSRSVGKERGVGAAERVEPQEGQVAAQAAGAAGGQQQVERGAGPSASSTLSAGPRPSGHRGGRPQRTRPARRDRVGTGPVQPGRAPPPVGRARHPMPSAGPPCPGRSHRPPSGHLSPPLPPPVHALRNVPSGGQDDLLAVVPLVLEQLVALRRFGEGQPVGDHPGGVDGAPLDQPEQGLHVALHVALAGAQRQ